MKIINIESRDVYFITEFSLAQLTYLKNLLDHANISYNSEQEPEMTEAVEYMNKELYPMLQWFEEYKQKNGLA